MVLSFNLIEGRRHTVRRSLSVHGCRGVEPIAIGGTSMFSPPNLTAACQRHALISIC